MKLEPRTTLGLDPVVRRSDGSRRPPIVVPHLYQTYHWTGVDVNYGDIGDTIAEIQAIERWAASQNKPNEYNEVIDQDPDDKIYSVGGDYQAAHSAGENSISRGVLFLNGIHEPLKPTQLKKAQWLTAHLLETGRTDGRTKHRSHSDMPGAATACCGLIRPYVPQFANPYVEDDPQPAPPSPNPEPKPPISPVDPPTQSGVGHYLVTDHTTPWGMSAEAYQTGTRYPEILKANLPDKTPNPGERWKIPGFNGIWTTVQRNEGPWSILDRLFGSDGWNKSTGIRQFWVWNGGDPARGGRIFNGRRVDLQVGEKVWVRN